MTFAELIDPLRSESIRAAVATSNPTITRWRNGTAFPFGWQIVPLAALLRVEPGELAIIIHRDVCGDAR